MKRSLSQEPTGNPQAPSSLRPNLSKRLLGYSATVAACVATAPDSEAVIVPFDPLNGDPWGITLDAATQLGDEHIASFDIDGDGAPDIKFGHYSKTFGPNNTLGQVFSAGLGQPNSPFIDRVGADGTMYVGGVGPGAMVAYPLRFNTTTNTVIFEGAPGFQAPTPPGVSSLGDPLYSNSVGPARGFLARSDGGFGAPNFNSHWYLNGTGFVEGYIGIRFLSTSLETNLAQGNDANVYGWIRIRVAGDDSMVSSDYAITILDAAYESSGGAIMAGAIPEPGSLGLLAFGGLGLLATRRRRQQQNGRSDDTGSKPSI